MNGKRTTRVILTNKARVLRDLRLEQRLSMRVAGQQIGRSASYIAHLETGRMDLPKGERLQRLLQNYGGLKLRSFLQRARTYKAKALPHEELKELVSLANDEQANVLLAITKGFLSKAQTNGRGAI